MLTSAALILHYTMLFISSIFLALINPTTNYVVSKVRLALKVK